MIVFALILPLLATTLVVEAQQAGRSIASAG
jgi:hypothetical protein